MLFGSFSAQTAMFVVFFDIINFSLQIASTRWKHVVLQFYPANMLIDSVLVLEFLNRIDQQSGWRFFVHRGWFYLRIFPVVRLKKSRFLKLQHFLFRLSVNSPILNPKRSDKLVDVSLAKRLHSLIPCIVRKKPLFKILLAQKKVCHVRFLVLGDPVLIFGADFSCCKPFSIHRDLVHSLLLQR
jgi:hypothetical protein